MALTLSTSGPWDIGRAAHPPAVWEDGHKCPLSERDLQAMPVRSSHAVAAAREETPSLDKMLPRWWATVRSLRTSSSAIWRFVLPRATSRSTSASRSVRPPASLRREWPPAAPALDRSAGWFTRAWATASTAHANASSNDSARPPAQAAANVDSPSLVRTEAMLRS